MLVIGMQKNAEHCTHMFASLQINANYICISLAYIEIDRHTHDIETIHDMKRDRCNTSLSLKGKTHTKMALLSPNQGTREELVERLRADYDRNYFLTGDIDVPLYTEDCEFADPFTSFRGRQRFVQNLKILWIWSGV